MSLTRVRTVSGSVYELDTEGKRCRRVDGAQPLDFATPDWKEYVEVYGMRPGGNLLIIWAGEDDHGRQPMTRSSTIDTVEEVVPRHVRPT